MTRIRIFMVVLIITLVAAPMFAARGSADFTRFVAIGDSYGAGVESGSLNLNHQPFSWPSVLAASSERPIRRNSMSPASVLTWRG